MITLVLGGSRSGKSAAAERLAMGLPQPVAYLATAVVGDDPDFARRIDSHRARRPQTWTTIEVGAALTEAVEATAGSILVDSLGTWVAAKPDFAVDAPSLCHSLRSRGGDAVIVSEEVGLGVHPSTAVGARFRDALGDLNQAVAAIADEVLLMVAGRALRLDTEVASPAGRPAGRTRA